MKYSGKFLAAILAVILCLGVAVPALAAPAPADVEASAWYAAPVRYALDNALMSADSDGRFDPEAAVTGGDFAKSLRALDPAQPADASDAPLTREQAVSALYGYAVGKGIDVSVGEDTNILSFNDAFDITEGYAPAFQWACGAGIIYGTDEGNLVPQGGLTRAQLAAILMRYCTLVGSYPIQPLVGTSTDYSDADNWLRIPEITKAVDTVYIYPTVFVDASPDAPQIVPIDNARMRAGAEMMYGRQASAYEKYTNVFAPYYRQSNLMALSGMSDGEMEQFQMQEQRTDVYGALDYYFEHYNEGRPFILAGHSQGSTMTKIVLGEYMQQHPEYYKRMVAAYMIGFSVTDDFLAEHPYLKFAEGADDTGVIVSWNTEGPGNKGQNNVVVNPGAISINPLNWKRDETYASVEENLGSLRPNAEGVYELTDGMADAQVDTERGVVICTTSTEYAAQTAFFGPASLHTNDYEFYYANIQENAGTRADAYLGNTGAAAQITDLVGTPTDYSNPDNWIAQPTPDKSVDTFYIYPTAYMPSDPNAPSVCAVDDEGMRAGARRNFAVNEGAYSESTNVFAPFYRQTSVKALENLGVGGADAVLRQEPRTDIYAALDYYFENLNGGRPFILAGHSQGSMIMRIILKEYMAAHPDYYSRMVAAYAIGYSVTKTDLAENPHLKFAERADDTGVIVSWNTEGPGNGDSRLVLPGAISINPINWKRDGTYAPASENLGSLVDGEIVTPGVADAQVDVERGVVICTNTDYPYLDVSAIADTPVFGDKSFHGNDYTFYYANIRENVATRVNAYLANG